MDYSAERPPLASDRVDGKLCPISRMTDDTLGQLYLAFRMVAIERHMETVESVSSFADDLFITRNEDRTAVGNRTLVEIRRHTQSRRACVSLE